MYLAVTTQPIIFGAALVGKDGSANFAGLLPVSELTAGGHNIRVVGLREISGISTDQNGEIVLSSDTIKEIERFDGGTTSTIKVLGSNSGGGLNLVIREVDLDKTEPWWTVWFAFVVSLILIGAKRYRLLNSKKSKLVLLSLPFICALPALGLGWYTATYQIMAFGTLVALVGVAAAWLIPARKLSNQTP